MFETRSQAWRDVGLLRQIDRRIVKRARLEVLLLVPVFVAIVVLYEHRASLLGVHPPRPHHEGDFGNTLVQIATVVALLILGWAIARDIGRAFGPALFRRMEPGTAGTVGFLIRLMTVGVALLVALDIAGVQARTLLVGGAFTAVVFGLAAQQTLGNVIAGTVLLSARPFQVGDRVRLQGGSIAGQVEGIVSSLGLLYTTFATGEDSVMVPNSIVLAVAVRPVREPDAVKLRARLPVGMTPTELQELLDRELKTPMRNAPRITLEELDGDEAIVQISATPTHSAQGRHLASELLAVVSQRARASEPDAEQEPAPAP